ncbi:uncharacterized protein DS421_7g201050 [Arachis hypogaea]|nr:uncharacterized protein DS421_7g201050 [Arachis hypogaea]
MPFRGDSALLHFKTELITDTAFYEYDRDYADLCPHVYPKMSTWGNGTNCCSWMGVTCHSLSGHVIGLDLSCSGVVGNIHPNSTLFHLIHLQTLSLAYNYIYGDVPFQISHLYKLQSLDLSWNHELEWKESTWKRMLQNATALSEIVLDKTDMTLIGPTPNPFSLIANLSSTLVTLSLDDTSINGYVTSDMLCLPNLQYLSLSSPPGVGHEGIQIHVLNLNCTTSLRFLDLSRCYFQGPIPSSFSNLTYLTSLNLVESNLNGSIPSSLSNLQHLTHLDLSGNRLKGQFPWHRLEFLDLSFNSMVDDISSFFCNEINLRNINLSHNNFTGTFPQCLLNISLPLALDIQMNKLHGTLPDTFNHLVLVTLNLNGNQFEGLLPKSLPNCTELVDLNLGNNQFEDTFPNWLQNLLNLKILVLRGNKLHGPIAELKSEKMFSTMKIPGDKEHSWSYYIQTGAGISGEGRIQPEYHDSITATIKGTNTPYAKIPRVLAMIDLSENKFEGEIPDVFGELQALISLNLSHNSLIGPIPRSLGNLTNLESLDLSSNMLDGNIPAELTNLNFLEVLNLSQNQLVGPIPRGKQFDTFSNNSYVGNLGLCGLPLSIQCNNNVPLKQYPSSEAEDKFGFGWKPVAIGYACGMVLGIGLGFCVFSIGKPQWLVIMFGGKRIKRRSRGNRRARTT